MELLSALFHPVRQHFTDH